MLTKKDKKKRYNKRTKTVNNHLFDGTAVQDFKDSFTQGDKLGGTISALGTSVAGIIGESIKEPELQGTEAVTNAIENQQNFRSTANTMDEVLAEMAGSVNVRTDYNANEFKRSAGQVAGEFIGDSIASFASGVSSGSWITGALNTGLSIAKNAIKRGRENGAAKQFAQDAPMKAIKGNLARAQTLTHKAAALDQQQDAASQRAYMAYGGNINAPKFSDFPSEVTEFNTGGSHEENPYDGIPQGIAPDGLPNLVEEGEVKFDNYIFSDRLMLNKNDKKKYKFLKGKTYADAAKRIKKDLGIDERPNDLITKTDLEEQLNLLSMLQEEERAKRGLRGENRMMYAKGGHLFSGDEDYQGQFDREGKWVAYNEILPFSAPILPFPPLRNPDLKERLDFISEDTIYILVPSFDKKGNVKKDKKGNIIYSRLPDDDTYWPMVTGKNAQITSTGFPTSKGVESLAAGDLQLNVPNERRSPGTHRGNFNTNNGYYLFDNEEDAYKAGMDWNPPKDVVVIDENAVNKDLLQLEKKANNVLDRELARQSRSRNNNFDWSSTLQAAPVVGSAVGLIHNIFDKPNNEYIENLTQAENSVTPVTYTPTHKNIRLSRFDKNFYMNKADAQAAAIRKAIREQTASNPYASIAALLPADYQMNAQRGDIRKQATELDNNTIIQEAQLNNAGRRADAEGLLKAASANATLQDKALTRKAEKDLYTAKFKMAEEQARDAAMSANLTGLFDNLGAMGKEDREFALAAMKIFGEGKVTPEMQAMMLPKLQKILAKAGYKYGGKLRKKKGYTI